MGRSKPQNTSNTMEQIDDIVWLKAEELKIRNELREAESSNPDSILSYNLRNELEEVRDSIDFFNSVNGES